MNKHNSKAWLYLLPALLFLGAFMVYPLIDVFVYSAEEGYNFASQSYFGTGLYNYSYVLHDILFSAGGKKHLYPGDHHGSGLHSAGAFDLSGPKLHPSFERPLPDHLFSALRNEHPGSRSGLYGTDSRKPSIRTD